MEFTLAYIIVVGCVVGAGIMTLLSRKLQIFNNEQIQTLERLNWQWSLDFGYGCQIIQTLGSAEKLAVLDMVEAKRIFTENASIASTLRENNRSGNLWVLYQVRRRLEKLLPPLEFNHSRTRQIVRHAYLKPGK